MAVKDPELQAYVEQLEPLRLDAHELVDGLGGEQFNWRPAASQWSVGQCIEHITLSLRLYPERVEQAIVEARSRSADGRRAYREGWFSRWFVRSMEPPPGMRVRTRRSVDPPADLQRDVVMRAFDAELTRFGELITAADGVPLRHGRVQSPFSPLFRFTLSQTFALNLAHARRHVWQARRVRTDGGFPAQLSGG